MLEQLYFIDRSVPQVHATLLDCTLVDNHASNFAGAIHQNVAGSAFLANCVLWGNTAPLGSNVALLGSMSSLAVEFRDVQGGMGSVHLDPGASLDWQGGFFDLVPFFVDPDGADDLPATTADNDYRLGAGSPCVDSGDDPRIAPDLHDLDGDGDTSEAVPFDLDGLPRQADDPGVPDTGNGVAPIVDIGAYERQPWSSRRSGAAAPGAAARFRGRITLTLGTT